MVSTFRVKPSYHTWNIPDYLYPSSYIFNNGPVAGAMSNGRIKPMSRKVLTIHATVDARCITTFLDAVCELSRKQKTLVTIRA